MSLLKLLLLPARVTLPGVGVGILTTVAAAKLGRPLLVGAARVGLSARDGAARIVDEARSVATDARTLKAGAAH